MRNAPPPSSAARCGKPRKLPSPLCCPGAIISGSSRRSRRATLHLRKPDSLQSTVALLMTASLLYIPANVLPIMTTDQLRRATDDTILGGVVILMHHGDYPIAAVIFIASVLVPLSKLLALSWLCWSVSRRQPLLKTLEEQPNALIFKREPGGDPQPPAGSQ